MERDLKIYVGGSSYRWLSVLLNFLLRDRGRKGRESGSFHRRGAKEIWVRGSRPENLERVGYIHLLLKRDVEHAMNVGSDVESIVTNNERYNRAIENI